VAVCHQCQDQIALAAGGGADQPFKAECIKRFDNRHGRSVNTAFGNLESFAGRDVLNAVEVSFDQLDQAVIGFGEVSEGAFLAFAVLLDVGFAQQGAAMGFAFAGGPGDGDMHP